MIAQKILESNPEGLPDVDLSDEVDSNNEDLEQLRETVRGILMGFSLIFISLNLEHFFFSTVNEIIIPENSLRFFLNIINIE